MSQMGRLLVIAGLVMVVVGLAIWLAGRLGWRGLPGDIRYESEGVRFYFPIMTCLVVSVAVTALVWLIAWLRR
jgi:ABC-type anion transport system duplicated permease subunit